MSKKFSSEFEFEEMDGNTEEFLAKKYKKNIDELLDYFIKNENGTNILDRYAILVHIAQLTNFKFMWEMVNSFYVQIQTLIPEEIKKIMNDIKKKDSLKEVQK